MPDPITALISAVSIGGSLLSSDAQSDASNQATGAQTAASTAAIDEQRRQFDAMQKLLAPYVTGGTQAMTAQGNLLGLGGAPAQQQAIKGIESGQYAELAEQGENAILQNASATGGLRGGNVQGVLAQYRPALLNSLIQQQFGNLGGLTTIGANAATQTGTSGMTMAGNIGTSLGNIGTAQANNALTQGNNQSNLFGNIIPNALGKVIGLF
jgi:hypothetical protein